MSMTTFGFSILEGAPFDLLSWLPILRIIRMIKDRVANPPIKAHFTHLRLLFSSCLRLASPCLNFWEYTELPGSPSKSVGMCSKFFI